MRLTASCTGLQVSQGKAAPCICSSAVTSFFRFEVAVPEPWLRLGAICLLF